MAMTITPFPPRELAKLVLGYLAEEQLMTAYDEFLQSSPYLDALENEHDRVFMTPLRNIVAEYRALKIYVETCKPFALRRRLMGCANLLEAVKLLVHLVDTSRISCPEQAASRLSYDNVNMKTYSRVRHVCDVCSSLNRTSCACHALSKSNTSIEATLLEDLPGHHARKKHVKVLDSKEKTSSMSSNELFPLTTNSPEEMSSGGLAQDVLLVDSRTLSQGCNVEGPNLNSHSVREVLNANQKSDMLHSNLNNVSNSSQFKSCMSSGRPDLHSPAAASFQDFAAGVEGKNTVPDSSTSECLNSVIPVTNEDIVSKEASDSDSVTKKGVTKAHILLKVENHKNSTSCQTSSESPRPNACDPKQVHTLRPKPIEQKITILSDIKVDKGFPQGAAGAPAVLRHAAAPRALHSVLINGRRAFSAGAGHGSGGYTRDEIMAMPTIILVPAAHAGQLQKSNSFSVQPPNEASGASTAISATARSLGPLLIDVDSSASAQHKVHATATAAPPEEPSYTSENKVIASDTSENNVIASDTSENKAIASDTSQNKVTSDTSKNKVVPSDTSNNKLMESQGDCLTVKTGELKNATVPKDVEATNRSTPVSAPLPRKSSSTPRRSGHVRVLDFTTPRRLLAETIPENDPPVPPTPPAPPAPPAASAEVILSKSPSLHTLANLTETNNSDKSAAPKSDNVNRSDECAIATQSIQKIITVKKSDWDADLRALAVANAKMDTPKPKAKSTRRKKGSENKRDDQKSQEKKPSRRKSNVTRSTTKIKFKSLEVIEDSVEIFESSPPAVAVKPTINIITEHDWGTIPAPEENNKNKSNNEDETDTPEMERLSLQNAIGAKLNISDLLETPYKQVLYDIQMETPRFLGPDLPGDPLSDIKIMNIPTPRFLTTPKPPQATPSSYSSRPTDYSSSSSYYKPDDHDCIDIGYPAPPPKETPPESKDVKNKSKEKLFKSSRPVRKCTKNVSYVNSPNIKAKDGDKDDDSVNSEPGLNESKTPKELKSKTPKTDTKRKSIGIKKRKTPTKKETPKSFMKIKPRRPTPVKDSGKKIKQSGTPGRKRTVSRDKTDSVTPAVASVPTKSRRKSSTPRKLHCTKQFHSESSGHESPDMVDAKNVPTRASSGSGVPDSDAEPPLRWSDEGTQDSAPADTHTKPVDTHTKPVDTHTKPVNTHMKTVDIYAKPVDTHTKPGQGEQNTTSLKPRLGSINETEDITKIQEYLAKSEPEKSLKAVEGRESNLHIDLVRRGFDIETAKIIERDLLDTPPYPKENLTVCNEEPASIEGSKEDKIESSVREKGESVSSTSVDIDVEGNDDEEDEVELSVHECNEDSKNYIVCHHDDIKDIPRRAPEKLKDKFSMEICLDDDVAIRLRANPLTFLIDEEPKDEDRLEYNRETEIAVSSISGMPKLYTPLKDPRAQCYEIFDSTLTSLDTPLKVDTPKRRDPEMTVTEIVLEVEKVDVKGKVETKRKRVLSGNTSDESTNENKKSKPDPQYLLNPANIKNIDIETVLCKLHGP